MGESMLFIVGRGRSGTTLLADCLNAVPGVSVAPECMFIMNLRGRYEHVRFTARSIDRFCEDLYLEERIRDWSFDKPELRDFLHARDDGTLGFAEVCRLVYAAHAQLTGVTDVRLLGDKNPHYSLFVPTLARLFPEARFLHLTRDARANVASYRKVRFDSDDVAVLAWRWKAYNDAILEAAPLVEGRYLRIRFEPFIEHHDAAMRQILTFLSITDRAGTADFGRRPTRVLPPSEWHSRLDKPLDPSVSSEWQRFLAPDQQRLVLTVCNPTMNVLGYAAGPVDGSPVLRLKAALGAWRGRISVSSERLLFRAPLRVRALVLSLYRRWLKTL